MTLMKLWDPPEGLAPSSLCHGCHMTQVREAAVQSVAVLLSRLQYFSRQYYQVCYETYDWSSTVHQGLIPPLLQPV